MCLEDVRLGRKKYTAVRQVTVGAGAVPLLAFALKRTHITIHTFNAGNVQVSPAADNTPFNSDGTFTVTRSNPPIDFDVEVHGDMVTKEWRASAAAPIDIIVVETFLDVE